MSMQHDTTLATAAPQFRTICRIGYWLHVDAMWTAERDRHCGLTNNYIRFRLADGWGHSVPVGYSIITTDDTGLVIDDDGEQFPDLETAIRHRAESSLKLEWQWTGWQDRPPLHPSAGDGKATEVAFSQRDIARAAPLTKRGNRAQ